MLVDKLYSEFSALSQYLVQHSEISFGVTLDEYFRKNLLLCSASYFEHKITSDVLDYAHEVASGNMLLPSLVRNKAISRQYHTWFDWTKSNANKFFALFGESFTAFMTLKLCAEPALPTAIRDFLQIGNDRNRLVHQNFGSFSLEKTADEIYKLHQSANTFVERIPGLLRECSEKT